MSRSSWPSSSSIVAMRGGIPRTSMLGVRSKTVNRMHAPRCASRTAPGLVTVAPGGKASALPAQPRLAALSKRVDRNLVVEIARAVLSDVRARIVGDSNWTALGLSAASVEELISTEVERILSRSLQPVINATGVILHTNLGRAPLPETVVDEFRRSATQYSNLEYDLEAGARGKRDVHAAELLTRLTGAEAAIVVNNCAAAVLVTLSALARGGAP